MDKKDSFLNDIAKVFSFEEVKKVYQELKAEPPTAIIYDFCEAQSDKRFWGRLKPNRTYRKSETDALKK